MVDQAKHFVIAPKLAARDKPSSGWEQQVGQIPGVEVLGSGGGMMQIRATGQALKAVTDRLGDQFNIEEAAARSTDV